MMCFKAFAQLHLSSFLYGNQAHKILHQVIEKLNLLISSTTSRQFSKQFSLRSTISIILCDREKCDRFNQLARVKLLANQLNIEFPLRNCWNVFRINDAFTESNSFFSTSARNIWKIGYEIDFYFIFCCVTRIHLSVILWHILFQII